jgi:hypothetical protein
MRLSGDLLVQLSRPHRVPLGHAPPLAPDRPNPGGETFAVRLTEPGAEYVRSGQS